MAKKKQNKTNSTNKEIKQVKEDNKGIINEESCKKNKTVDTDKANKALKTSKSDNSHLNKENKEKEISKSTNNISYESLINSNNSKSILESITKEIINHISNNNNMLGSPKLLSLTNIINHFILVIDSFNSNTNNISTLREIMSKENLNNNKDFFNIIENKVSDSFISFNKNFRGIEIKEFFIACNINDNAINKLLDNYISSFLSSIILIRLLNKYNTVEKKEEREVAFACTSKNIVEDINSILNTIFELEYLVYLGDDKTDNQVEDYINKTKSILILIDLIYLMIGYLKESNSNKNNSNSNISNTYKELLLNSSLIDVNGNNNDFVKERIVCFNKGIIREIASKLKDIYNNKINVRNSILLDFNTQLSSIIKLNIELYLANLKVIIDNLNNNKDHSFENKQKLILIELLISKQFEFVKYFIINDSEEIDTKDNLLVFLNILDSFLSRVNKKEMLFTNLNFTNSIIIEMNEYYNYNNSITLITNKDNLNLLIRSLTTLIKELNTIFNVKYQKSRDKTTITMSSNLKVAYSTKQNPNNNSKKTINLLEIAKGENYGYYYENQSIAEIEKALINISSLITSLFSVLNNLITKINKESNNNNTSNTNITNFSLDNDLLNALFDEITNFSNSILSFNYQKSFLFFPINVQKVLVEIFNSDFYKYYLNSNININNNNTPSIDIIKEKVRRGVESIIQKIKYNTELMWNKNIKEIISN